MNTVSVIQAGAPGPRGQKGDQGIQGIQGIQGVPGEVTTVQMNSAIEAAMAAGRPVQTYSPVVSIWTLGNGTTEGWYVDFGKIVEIYVKVVFGASGAVFTTASPRISLPSGITSALVGESSRMFLTTNNRDVSPAGTRLGRAECVTSGLLMPLAYGVVGSNINDIAVTSTVPITWAAGDYIEIAGKIRKP